MTFNDWITQPGIFYRWLEAQFGPHPWFIFGVVTPIVVFLLIFLLRRLALAVLFRFEKPREYRESVASISFYVATLLGIFSVGGIWRVRAQWLADSLRGYFGGRFDQLDDYLVGVIYSVMAILVLFIFLYMIQKGIRFAIARLDSWVDSGKGIRFQKAVLVKPIHIRQTSVLLLRIIRLALVLAAFYIYIPLLLSFFPLTAPFAGIIMPYVTGPIIRFAVEIVAYLPKLVTLILIILVIRYLLRFLKLVMSSLEKEEIRLPGFDADWADPTYRLIRGISWLLGVMICYPYLPGAGSEIFKGFSIFVGALVTLGSSAAINNIISGVVLTYARAFRVGDRVQIGDTLGDIVEKRLFVTRMRTAWNEEVTLPNGTVLGGSITNLSAAAKNKGLALRVSAGIGYDVDWKQVHELMKEAAQQTPGILSEPEPHVLETELGDFAVNYTLVAFTDEAKNAPRTRAVLRRNLLDVFNIKGVEIMTPSVSAVRDGNQPAIPADYDPKPLSNPGIRLFSLP